MDDKAHCNVTVSVLLHSLGRLYGIVAKPREVDLELRPASNGFTAGVQFSTAQNFALRAVITALGREISRSTGIGRSKAVLAAWSAEIRALFAALLPSGFGGRDARMVTVTAGQGGRTQTKLAYVTPFALPNLFFHLTSGYAPIRAAGTALGKAHHAGIHYHPQGFRF